MSNSKNSNAVIAPSAVALIPLIVFLSLFIGVGTYLSLQGVDFAFYQLPAPIAALPAVMLALLLSKDTESLQQFYELLIATVVKNVVMIVVMLGVMFKDHPDIS